MRPTPVKGVELIVTLFDTDNRGVPYLEKIVQYSKSTHA